ncbi:uncharacterized protein LOC108912850 isoform X3 [Anoplophora glabripennis]|uniref:uncharacterized protein LOC108912850 isoform X3 n=1 Tax=Anoplophora glabripennis TaxID=217634 RepID=UPI0008740E29|nr:uncharacterized protein LOC108912850 isoform X3 [Anoplophora glabripennis]
MQTKNINAERQPNSNNSNDNKWTEKTLLMVQQHSVRQNLIIPSNESGNNSALEYDAPPLPPRSAVIFSSMSSAPKIQVEVEGYGPYKPVPPPKPLPQQALQSQELQQLDCFTPPPYRMPPYPLFNEPNIPGAAGLDHPIASSSPATPQGLHTHSSKFPIEREVILSSTDKNSKIPILHDYKKRTKASVAPDAPPKQMAAWTQGQIQNHQILPDQTHSGLIQTIQQSADPSGATYRATYHPIQEYYNGPNPNTTGAVPRSSWHTTVDPNKPAPRPMQPTDDFHNPQTVSVQIECKDQVPKEQKNPKSMTKTYHTIKDIISNRFKSSREIEEKTEETGLNNNADETRKTQIGTAEEQEKKPPCDQVGYQKQPMQQYQYNQHYIQQHMLAQQAQQQYQQQLKSHHQYNQQLAQARSQEMLTPRPEEQLYYQSNYPNNPPRGVGRFVQQTPSREQNFVTVQPHVQFQNGKESQLEDRRALTGSERRSAQQLERDNLRQRSFEARRAASQPQLAYDDEVNPEVQNNRPPLQVITPVRRGSHGNIMEAQMNQEMEKDSDDGGFLKRKGSRERRLDAPPQQKEGNMQNESQYCESKKEHKSHSKEDPKVTDGLHGTPRRKLEGEIGKIEGVYNVGQRSTKVEDETKIPKKNPSSATSSDYDKTGGQSSSNVDSGRGSAAYSSGRRPGGIDLNGETFDSGQMNPGNNYRDAHGTENELRHILEPKLHELSLQGKNAGVANSTFSESISSMTPPLPPLSPGDQSSPNETPRNSARYKHSSLPFGSKPDYDGYKGKAHTREVPSNSRWNSSSQKHRTTKKMDHSTSHRGKQIFGLENLDITSTTTRSMDLESILDGQSDSEGDMSTTDARTIRKQLEGLEMMYSEVLKLLGVNKKHTGRYQPSDPRFSKRRYGSMSSLPSSSVSSRPIRDKRRATEERKKVRDIRGINKRFQRLESHVVTLARSVAHLSSEMRTQHLMIQEMENIRGEIAALRTQTNMLNVRSQSASRAVSSKELPTLANPTRVKKLTKFFGDEPPLLRLFLRKLGYEKYATLFESERVGMVELPYMSEERLQKMGVPLGPRLRIMQEAQISVCKDNTLCIV